MPENISLFDRLQRQQRDIAAVLRNHEERFVRLRDLAAGLHADMEELGSFVQLHTAVVCPDCISVCCINRHSYHTADDMVYIYALSKGLPLHAAGLDEAAPCQFLGRQGCTIARSLRPYRCNWYFCTPLLEDISQRNSRRQFRFFIGLLERITAGRLRMMEEFASVSSEIVGKPVVKPG